MRAWWGWRGPGASVVVTVVLLVSLWRPPPGLASPPASWRQPTGSGSPTGTSRGVGAGGLFPRAHEEETPFVQRNLTIGLLVPHTNFGVREYVRAVNQAVAGLTRSRGVSRKFDFMRKYNFTQANVHSAYMTLTPAPKGKRSALLVSTSRTAADKECQHFTNTATVLWKLTNKINLVWRAHDKNVFLDSK